MRTAVADFERSVTTRRGTRWTRWCLACVVWTIVIATPSLARAGSLTVLWDESPDPQAAGYIVYASTTQGIYSEAFDVGARDSFEYVGAVAGQRYYFAIAAYDVNGIVGELSEEVSEVSGPGTSYNTAVGLSSGSPRTVDASPVRRVVCANAGSRCFSVRTVATGLNAVTAVTPIQDGRLLFIEAGTRIRVVDAGGLVAEPALAVDSATSRFVSLTVDPTFNATRFVFVADADTARDGSLRLNVTRYRELANRLGEGATIVPGLPMGTAADAPMAMDAQRRLYVALPAAPATPAASASDVAGVIVRFTSDGAVPDGQRNASPVLTQGYTHPTSMWRMRDEAILVGGADNQGRVVMAALHPEDSASPAPPRLLPIDAAGVVNTPAADLAEAVNPAVLQTALQDYGEPVAAARSADRRLYVAVRAVQSGSPSFALLALTPAD